MIWHGTCASQAKIGKLVHLIKNRCEMFVHQNIFFWKRNNKKTFELHFCYKFVKPTMECLDVCHLGKARAFFFSLEALIYSFQLDYTQNLSQMDSCGFEKHERRKIIIFFYLPSPGSVLIKKYLVS